MHVAVTNAYPLHQLVQLFGISHGLGRATHIRLGDNFQQRRPGAVQVNARHPFKSAVYRFTCIFFQMRTRDIDHFFVGFGIFSRRHLDGDFAFTNHWQLELADLVTFGQIRIKVILARKHAARGHFSFNRQTKLDGAFNGFFVEYRQHTWQGDAHFTRLRIGLRPIGGRSTAKLFGFSL